MKIEDIEALEKRAEICSNCQCIDGCYCCKEKALSPEEILTAIKLWKFLEANNVAQKKKFDELQRYNVDCTKKIGSLLVKNLDLKSENAALRAKLGHTNKVMTTEWETPESCPDCLEHLSLDWSYCPECGKPTQWSKNEPLSLDELRQMDGEPVWIVAKHLPSYCDIVHILGTGWIRIKIQSTLQENGYGKTWLAYRRKPDKEG